MIRARLIVLLVASSLFPASVKFQIQRRRQREGGEKKKMGGGHGGHGTTYKGVTLHAPKRWHSVTGKGMCAIMWFWVLYRAKQDGPVVLGWRHPWEGHGDHGHEHGPEESH